MDKKSYNKNILKYGTALMLAIAGLTDQLQLMEWDFHDK